MAKFLLINHSEADFSILAGNVTVWGRTQKSEEDAEGSFSFTTNLGPLESKELSAPVNTKLQNLRVAGLAECHARPTDYRPGAGSFSRFWLASMRLGSIRRARSKS